MGNVNQLSGMYNPNAPTGNFNNDYLSAYGVLPQPYMQVSQSNFNAAANPQTAQAQSPQGTGVNASSLLQNASTLNNLTGSKVGGSLFNGVSNTINNLGASYLGTAIPASEVAAGGVPTALSGGSATEAAAIADANSFGPISGIAGSSSALGATSLTGFLGAAGIGYFGGGVLANLLGENQTGGSIGGAIGATIGTAIFPGVGSVVGGIIGSVAGGLFGNNKPSDMTQVGGVKIASGKVNPVYQSQESSTGSEFNANNQSNASTMQQGAANLSQWLLANGATPKGNIANDNPNLVIKVGSRDGIQIGIQNESSGPGGKGAPTTPVYYTTLDSKASAAQVADATAKVLQQQYNISPDLAAKISKTNLETFFSPNYNSSQLTAGGAQGTNSAGLQNQPNFITPTIAPANNQGRGIMQIPSNSTGQTGVQG
jgi:Glycine zipper